MTTKLKKIIKKVDPLMGGDAILDKVGLPSMFGDEFGFVQEQKAISGSTVEAPAAAPVAAEGLDAREAQRRRQLAMAGMAGNQLTGPSGLSGTANTQMKSLLGS